MTDPQLANDWPRLRPIHNELSLSEQDRVIPSSRLFTKRID